MSLTLRILLGFLVVGGAAFYFLLDRVLVRMERQYMEAVEDPMVDAAYLMAAFVSTSLGSGEGFPWAEAVDEAVRSNPRARIFHKLKDQVEMDFYLTDGRGHVIYDSSGSHAIGADYSRYWDVYHTLRGSYGARATRSNPMDDRSGVLYVAAPIRHAGRTLGVLSVYKPQRSLTAFISQTRKTLFFFAAGAMAAMLVGGLLASHWITSPVRQLTSYAGAVAAGQKPRRPRFTSRAMDRLARAFEEMRDAVDGKNAVEAYVQTLTHEMKSPVAAIRGAAELLAEPMPEAQRTRFLSNIRAETDRLANLTERLLVLSAVERQKEPAALRSINLEALLREEVHRLEPLMQNRHITTALEIQQELRPRADEELLRLAVANLLRNAIEFSPERGRVAVSARATDGILEILIRDQGPGIPDFAQEKVFDRFYSLPRPDTGKKSTGLGLCFVQEASKLHGGSVHLESAPGGGTLARLRLPLST